MENTKLFTLPEMASIFSEILKEYNQRLELLTINEVAQLLKISPATIDNWLCGREGKTPPVGFPPPVDFVKRVWRSDTIQKFILEIPFNPASRIPVPGRIIADLGVPMALKNPVRGRGRPRKIQALI